MLVIKAGDSERTITDLLTVNGAAVDLTSATVTFVVRAPDGFVTHYGATVTSPPTGGLVSYRLTGTEFPMEGNYEYGWGVVFQDNGAMEFPEAGWGGVRVISALG